MKLKFEPRLDAVSGLLVVSLVMIACGGEPGSTGTSNNTPSSNTPNPPGTPNEPVSPSETSSCQRAIELKPTSDDAGGSITVRVDTCKSMAMRSNGNVYVVIGAGSEEEANRLPILQLSLRGQLETGVEQRWSGNVSPVSLWLNPPTASGSSLNSHSGHVTLLLDEYGSSAGSAIAGRIVDSALVGAYDQDALVREGAVGDLRFDTTLP